MSRRHAYRVLVTALLLGCAPAHAHLVTTGLGPLYDGIVHFFVSIEDLLPVLALALFAGLNGAAAGRRALFLAPAAWFVGGTAAGLVAMRTPSPLIGVIALLGLGLYTALDRPARDSAVAVIAAGVGLALGLSSTVAAATPGGSTALGLIGACASAFVVIALAAATAVRARPGGASRIVVRVAASWLAAIGLLRLGWWLSGAG